MLRLTLALLVSMLFVGPTSTDEVFDLNEKARAALERGQVTDAVQLLESARRLQPADEVLSRNLAYAYFVRGKQQLEDFDLDGAAADYKRAIATYADEPGYALHLASLELRRYELRSALQTLRDAVGLHPENGDVYLLTGDVLNLYDSLPEAVEAYEFAIEFGDDTVQESARRLKERTERQLAVERDYRTENSGSFLIRHPPQTRFLELVDVLERARAEVCNELNTFPRNKAIVVLYPPEAFREVTGTHEWVGGLFDRKIRLPIGDLERERPRVEAAFRHEFAHLIVSEIAPRCPTYVNEGLAQVVEHGRGQGMERLVTWLDEGGVARSDVPHLADLPDSFMDVSDRNTVNLGYLLSYAFVDHVIAIHGSGVMMRWLQELNRRPIDEAYKAASRRSLEHEEELFRELLRTARG